MGIFSRKKNADTSKDALLEELSNKLSSNSNLAIQKNRLFGKLSTDAVIENDETHTVSLLKFDWDVNSVHFGSVMHLGRVGNEARMHYFNQGRQTTQTTAEGSEPTSRTVKSLLFVKTKNGEVGSYSTRIKDISERIGVTIFYVSGIQEVTDILLRLSQEELTSTQNSIATEEE